MIVGLIGGFTGAALLVSGSAGAGVPVGGMLVAVAATLCWTVGSLYARGAPLPKAPLLGSGMQQLVGGGVILSSRSRSVRAPTSMWARSPARRGSASRG